MLRTERKDIKVIFGTRQEEHMMGALRPGNPWPTALERDGDGAGAGSSPKICSHE